MEGANLEGLVVFSSQFFGNASGTYTNLMSNCKMEGSVDLSSNTSQFFSSMYHNLNTTAPADWQSYIDHNFSKMKGPEEGSTTHSPNISLNFFNF